MYWIYIKFSICILISYKSVSDKQYKPFPYVNQSTSVIYISDEVIIANITCDAGFQFPNSAVTNAIRCNRNTYEWDYENYLPCIGRQSIHFSNVQHKLLD